MKLSGITIDGVSSRDLDDAVEARQTDKGIEVTVCISDVASLVPRGHKLDVGFSSPDDKVRYEGAYERVATRYFGKGNDPMLPRATSEGSASLFEGQPRKAMAVRVTLDPASLDVLANEVVFGDFVSRKRLSHPDVPAILAAGEHPLKAEVSFLASLGQRLVQKRRRGGAFVLYDLNSGWVTDEEGVLRRLGFDEANVGYVIVQELMILANAQLARWAAMRELPVPFRNHTAKAHAPAREEILGQMDALAGQALDAVETLRERVNLVMNRADYGSALKGHYGLNLPAYVHATSPIRRYADLVTQRQVRAEVLGEPRPYTRDEVEAVCEHMNAKIQEDRDAKAEWHRSRAKAEAGRASERDDALSRLTSKEFDRVCKAMRDGGGAPTEPFGRNFLSRLSQGALSILAREVVLFETPPGEAAWRPLREAVISRLAEAPHEAVTLAATAAQAGSLAQVSYKEARLGGPDHGPTFGCTATATVAGREVSSGRVVAGSAKAAQQRAAVRLVALASGLEPPAAHGADAPPPAPPPAKEPPRPEAPAESDNPVASLQEFCQARGSQHPDYSFRQTGPSHAPTFSCTCRLDGVERTAGGASKREAKHSAAALVVTAMRAAVTEGAAK